MQVSRLDALGAAKLLVHNYGAQEAWRILTARAIEEHLAGYEDCRTITEQVLQALHKLTVEPGDKPQH